jgi:threonine dehydratase
MNDIPTYADVVAAAKRIAGPAVRTPLVYSPILSERLDARVFLKAETLQRTGSFKFRGAYNTVKALGAEAAGGIVACSSGNHAQGVAEAARLAGLAATIVMPSDAPAVKRARTEASGARIVLYDRSSQDRDAVAAEVLAAAGGAMTHHYNDRRVIAGQGTAGLEIADDLEAAGVEPDVVLTPCSGGGLTAGLALALTERFPGVAIHAVEPEGFDDYARSLAAGRPVRNDRLAGSVCDALLSPEPGPIGFAINRERLAGAVSVSDEEALRAVGFAYEALRLIVEPGGAVALAALLEGRVEVAGRNAVVVLSGGNVGDDVLAKAVAAYRDQATEPAPAAAGAG